MLHDMAIRLNKKKNLLLTNFFYHRIKGGGKKKNKTNKQQTKNPTTITKKHHTTKKRKKKEKGNIKHEKIMLIIQAGRDHRKFNTCSKQSSHRFNPTVHSLKPAVYNASKDGDSMQNHRSHIKKNTLHGLEEQDSLTYVFWQTAAWQQMVQATVGQFPSGAEEIKKEFILPLKELWSYDISLFQATDWHFQGQCASLRWSSFNCGLS